MASQDQSYPVAPRVAIADGATSPDPGKVGAVAWSTTLSAPVYWDGAAWRQYAGGNDDMSGALPALPIREGAETPNPGSVGVAVWSTLAQMPLVWNGFTWHASADGLPITNKTYGVRVDGTNYYQALGGEKGLTTGFGVLVAWRAEGRRSFIFSNIDHTAKKGWQALIEPADSQNSYFMVFRFSCYNVNNVLVAIESALPAASIAQYHAFCVTYAANTLKIFGLGQYLSSQTTTLAYAPMVESLVRLSGALGQAVFYASSQFLGALTFQGAPAEEDVIALLHTVRGLPLGSMPSTMLNGVITHRYETRGRVPAGTLAPPTMRDAQTLAEVDQLVRVGSPTLELVDLPAAGTTTYGLLYTGTGTAYKGPNSVTSYMRSIRGHPPRGLTIAFDVKMPPGTTLKAFTLARCRDGALTPPAGYFVDVASDARVTWSTQYYGAAGALSGLQYVPVSGRVTLLMTCGPTSSTSSIYRCYLDGVEWGWTSGSISSFQEIAPGVVFELLIGEAPCILYGVTGGAFLTTEAQARDWHLRVRSTARIQPVILDQAIENTYDLTQDVIDSGGPANGAPATIFDRAADAPLTRQQTASSCAVVPHIHFPWSYDSAPLGHSLGGFSDTAYCESLVPIAPGKTTGFWIAMMVISTAFSPSEETLFSSTGSALTGGGFFVNYLASSIRFGLINTSNAIAYGGLASVQRRELGQPFMFLGHYNGTHARVMYNRNLAFATTGTAIAYKATTPDVTARLGRATLAGTGKPAATTRILGIAYGEDLLTYAEAYTYPDLVNNARALVPIPGKTKWLCNFGAAYAAAGLTVPATLPDEMGTYSPLFNRVGTLNAAPLYQRSWL